MPTNAIQFPAAQNPVQTAVQTDPQSARAGSNAPGAVLGGPGVRVSVAGSQLDKLVAKVKGESEDARLATAKRRIAIVLAFVISMFLTPPDPMSQLFMAIPLCLLYEVSIWAVWLKEKGTFRR